MQEYDEWDEDFMDQPWEEPQYIPNARPFKKRGKKFNRIENNPYDMDPYDVRTCHFKNPFLLYGGDIVEEGFEFSNQFAKKLYSRWLRDIRNEPGWENFKVRNSYSHSDFIWDPADKTLIPQKEWYNTTGNRESHHVVTNVTHYDYNNKYYYDSMREKHTYVGNPNGMLYDNAPMPENVMNYVMNKETELMKTVHEGYREKSPDEIDEEIKKMKFFTAKMGLKISQIRLDMKMHQFDLAKAVNVDVSVIRDIERGDVVPFNPNDKLVQNLVKVLDLEFIKYEV